VLVKIKIWQQITKRSICKSFNIKSSFVTYFFVILYSYYSLLNLHYNSEPFRALIMPSIALNCISVWSSLYNLMLQYFTNNDNFKLKKKECRRSKLIDKISSCIKLLFSLFFIFSGIKVTYWIIVYTLWNIKFIISQFINLS
jgi:hypothetical protein